MPTSRSERQKAIAPEPDAHRPGRGRIYDSITASPVSFGMHLVNNFLGFQVRNFAEDNVFAIKPGSWGESDEKSKSLVN